MPEGGPGTLDAVTVELGRLLQPLASTAEQASDDPEAVVRLLDDIGIRYSLSEGEIGGVGDSLTDVLEPWDKVQSNTIDPISEGKVPNRDQIEDAIEGIEGVFDAIESLEDLEVDAEAVTTNLAEMLVDYLVYQYLLTYRSKTYNLFCAVGIVTNQDAAAPVEVDLGMLPEAIANPEQIPEIVLGWGTPGFKAYLITYSVGEIVRTFHPPTSLRTAEKFALEEFEQTDPNLGRALDLPLLSLVEDGNSLELGLELSPTPGHEPSGTFPGLALIPYGEAAADHEEDLGNGWTLALEGSVQAKAMGVVAQPREGGEVRIETGTLREVHDNDGSLVEQGLSGGTLHLAASVTKETEGDGDVGDGDGEKQGTLLIGDPKAGGVYLDSLALKAALDADTEGAEFQVELPTESRITFRPQGGFLKKALPDEITSEFQLTPGFSTEQGIYFDGSAGIEVSVPINQELGPLKLHELWVSIGIDLDTGAIEPAVAISADFQLGPIDATVKRVGVGADLAFPEDRSGDQGIADLAVGLEPPSGVGLDLDQGPISGGGYIEYDPENERYAGVLDVQIGPVGVKLFGLLSTEMPDGTDGFSLLLSVFGEFPPVQLSFGFTLEGLGGVIGIHRSMQTKPLSRAVRSGNLDPLLFPEDPVANAQRIISDLRSIYPPTRSQHVFGPMVQLGWGSPTTVRLDLGVILQLPDVRVVILGKLNIGLPKLEAPDDAQIIRVNLDAAGVVDTQRQLVEIDASMYDSRVLMWTMKGDMALRAGWGANTAFVLSIGGFNPRFEPPSEFPDLERLTVCLDIPGGTPSVQWKGYLAVTANTFQVGASFDASFEAGPVSAEAWWSLDALFQFDPFMFVVDFEAGLLVAVKGFELGATLEGTIKGPSPVEINGQISVSLPDPIPDPSPRVSITLGEDEGGAELPPVDLLPEFGEELEEPSNWAAQLPEDGTTLVTLREIETGDDTVLAHPMGTLTVRQTLVPIGKEIERKGENRPRHIEYKFEVAFEGDSDDEDRLVLDTDVSERFAPAQYHDMSDSEKMDAPSFRKWPAGRSMGGELFTWGLSIEPDGGADGPGDNAATAVLEYDEADYDSELEEAVADAQDRDTTAGTTEAMPGRGNYPADISRALANDGAVANADSRWRGDRKFVPERVDEDATVTSNVDVDEPLQVVGTAPVVEEEAGSIADDVEATRMVHDEALEVNWGDES